MRLKFGGQAGLQARNISKIRNKNKKIEVFTPGGLARQASCDKQ